MKGGGGEGERKEDRMQFQVCRLIRTPPLLLLLPPPPLARSTHPRKQVLFFLFLSLVRPAFCLCCLCCAFISFLFCFSYSCVYDAFSVVVVFSLFYFCIDVFYYCWDVRISVCVCVSVFGHVYIPTFILAVT